MNTGKKKQESADESITQIIAICSKAMFKNPKTDCSFHYYYYILNHYSCFENMLWQYRA